MIKVTPQGTRSLATGKNIANPASTFLETGPKDELAGVDAYQGSASQFRSGAGSGMSLSGGGAGSTDMSAGEMAGAVADADCQDCASKLVAAGGNPNRRAEALGRRSGQVLGDNLWEALLCGPFPEEKDTTGNRQRQMDNAALWLRSTGCSAENLIDLLKFEGGRAGLNRAVLEERLSSAMGQSMTTLEPAFRDEMVRNMALLTGSDEESIRVAMANSQTTLTSEQASDGSALSQILGDITGSAEVIDLFDMHAEVAVISTLLDKSIEMGIPQAAERLMEEIKDDKVRQRVALNRLRSAAMASELEVVRSVIKNSGQAAAINKVPDLASLIIQYFRMPRKTTRDQYPDQLNNLLITLNAADVNWHSKQRDGQWVSNLEPFAMASDDALTLFANSSYALQAQLAPKYPETHYRNVARKYHPRAVLYGVPA